MGFNLHVNNILRFDITEKLEVGKKYKFEKDGMRIFADDIQIWLTKEDWTVLADISITSQERKDNKTSGTFKVNHLYSGNEQKSMTEVFKRMYGWK